MEKVVEQEMNQSESSRVSLEKIDLIRSRVHTSYRGAKEALEAAGGDVVEALIRLEGRPPRDFRMEDMGKKVMDQIKELVHRGNVTVVRIRKGGRVIMEFPATVGAVGIVGLLASIQIAVLGMVGMAAAVANRCVVEVEWRNEDGTTGRKFFDLDYKAYIKSRRQDPPGPPHFNHEEGKNNENNYQ